MMRLRIPMILLAAIALLSALSLQRLRAGDPEPRSAVAGAPRVPVLIELFTSEGCSSCPPADALLQTLDRSQPVPGAELIVLSEHVDYWNSIGWKDPYSSHEYSERQSGYANRFGLSGVYTPQMIVDGRFELVGSDERRAIRAVESATRAETVPVSLSSIHFESTGKIGLHVEAGPLPSSIAAKSANVFLAIADDRDESHVSRGENAGRTLTHVAVLRNLVQVGAVGRAGIFSRDVTVDPNNANPHNLRIVAIVQEPAEGRVWGAGSARLAN